jgi:hypothetical protein
MDKLSNRFVAVNLTDAEWRALRAITPDPCAWMKTQIQRLLAESGVMPAGSGTETEEPSEWGALTSPGI